MRRLTTVGLVLACLLLQTPAPRAQQQPQGARVASQPAAATSTYFAAERAAAERITAEEMKAILYTIASDEYAGRDTPSPGQEKAAQFIAERLKSLKVKPAGDAGSYFQRIALTKTEVDREHSSAQLGDKPFRIGVDFLPAGRASGDVEAPVVYAGYGWVIKSQNINPYEGVDVRDRIVVVSGDGSALPPGLTQAELQKLPGGDWETPVSYARKHGAKGLVLIPRNFQRRWLYGAFSAGRASYKVVKPGQGLGAEEESDEEEEGEPTAVEGHDLPAVIPSYAMLNALFAGEAADGARVLRASTGGEPVKGFALDA
ncbi:MAG TPA: hypothetical protein VF521_08175, partial [Pyrinomonadaceae bacterium]